MAAYYVVPEALTNAPKYANASAVHVDVEAVGEVVRLSVSEEDEGGTAPARGSGLVGPRDLACLRSGQPARVPRPAGRHLLLGVWVIISSFILGEVPDRDTDVLAQQLFRGVPWS